MIVNYSICDLDVEYLKRFLNARSTFYCDETLDRLEESFENALRYLNLARKNVDDKNNFIMARACICDVLTHCIQDVYGSDSDIEE